MKRTSKFAVLTPFWIALVFAQAPSSTDKKSEQPTRFGPIEITTDTEGIDFGPYLRQVLKDIKRNWYDLIPASAMPPMLKRGKVVIEFAITKNGQIAGMRYTSGSGDVALDRAAYGGIVVSNPFAPLPSEFHGQYLGLRVSFLYNPDPNEAAVHHNSRLNGISPPHVQVSVGSSLLFVPILSGKTDPTQFAISWSVVGQGCAELACGTISDNGMYTAPPKVPENPTITVRATTKADLTETASAAVTIVPPEPQQNNGQH